jgi:pheromone shutdown protein TraB
VDSIYRGLWDAAGKSQGRPIVGVVGAGHVRGISQAWPTIGSEESLAKVRELYTLPIDQTTHTQCVSPISATIVSGALLYPKKTLLNVEVLLTMTCAYLHVFRSGHTYA